MKLKLAVSLLILLLLLVAGTASAVTIGAPLLAGTPTVVATTAAAGSAATPAPAGAAAAPAAQTTTPVTATVAMTSTRATQAGSATAFATIDFQAGVPLDPFFISLQAGGPVEASTLDPSCTGYIQASPTLSFDYKGQVDVDLLKIFIYSDHDPVLVVQTPDGKYQCNDNTNRLLFDPSLQIDSPQPGRYNVWAGSTTPKGFLPVVLVLTLKPDVNVGNFRLGDLVKRPAIPAALPALTLNPENRQKLDQAMTLLRAKLPTLETGSVVSQTVTAEGSLPALQYTYSPRTEGDLSCNGYIRLLPTYVFNLTGQPKSLRFLFAGNHDATLAVRTPGTDGTFVCNDDAAGNNLNPEVDLANPKEGTYAVWVGRLHTDLPVTGTLTITDAANAQLPVLQTK